MSANEFSFFGRVSMVIQLCTCVVITGGYRVPTAAGCPLHPPLGYIPSTATNPLPIVKWMPPATGAAVCDGDR
jgi:hypothetical protein